MLSSVSRAYLFGLDRAAEELRRLEVLEAADREDADERDAVEVRGVPDQLVRLEVRLVACFDLEVRDFREAAARGVEPE